MSRCIPSSRMAVAAARTAAGLVHSTLADAGHPSPTWRGSITPRGGTMPLAPKVSSLPRRRATVVAQARGCLPAVHLVRLDGPVATEAHPVRQDRPAAGARHDRLERKWPVVVLVRRLNARTYTGGGSAECGRDRCPGDQSLHPSCSWCDTCRATVAVHLPTDAKLTSELMIRLLCRW